MCMYVYMYIYIHTHIYVCVCVYTYRMMGNPLEQWSPPFLASGTSFMEDNFHMDRGGGDDSGGNASHGERWGAMGSGR